MPNTPCAVRVQSDDPSPAWVAGVAVYIYNPNSIVLVTSGTTDGTGTAAFLLPDGPYDVRFYKQGVSILPSQPQRIVVDHTQVGNTFIVTGHVTSMPFSTDPLRCRITGTVLGPDGAPVKEVKISFIPAPDLVVINTNVLAPQLPMHLESDDNGYFDFTLLRSVNYLGYMTNVDTFFEKNPTELDVRVPNLASLGLNDLLFPLPLGATFSVSSITLPLVAGPNSTVFVSMPMSDGSTRTDLPPWVGITPSSTDGTIVDSVLIKGQLTLTPRKVGTTTLTYLRSISSDAIFNPVPAFTSGSLVVTVV